MASRPTEACRSKSALSWPSSSPGARLRIPCRNPSKPTRPELSTAHDRSACGTCGAGTRTACVPCLAARRQAALRLWYVQHAGGWCACTEAPGHVSIAQRELERALRRYVALAPLLGGERDDAVEVAHRRRVRRRSVVLVARRSPHASCGSRLRAKTLERQRGWGCHKTDASRLALFDTTLPPSNRHDISGEKKARSSATSAKRNRRAVAMARGSTDSIGDTVEP